jgi:threonine/homoserine/homoserine lactone efflux protein
MNIEAFNKILIFWFVFYITPGPVWLAVMATTAKQSTKKIITFFLKTFLIVNIIVQFSQAFLSVVFIEFVTKSFGEIGFIFYFFGSGYIFYLAYKALKAQQAESNLKLSFMNLAIIMLLSPKIWILFPSGAVIANELNLGLMLNASIYASIMFLTSSLLFFFYVVVGKIGQRVLKDNFPYLVFFLLSGFGLFLLVEGIRVIL